MDDERRRAPEGPWRARARRLSLLAALVACVLAAALVVDPASATAWSTPGPCRRVLFQGARGSGQATRGDAHDGRTGLGEQVYTLYRSFSAGLPSVAVDSIGPRYKSLGVESLSLGLNPMHYASRVGDWFKGLSAGVDAAYAHLVARALSCPNERIVLAGYSQGAMLEHRVIARLAANHKRAILQRIVTVALIGDGDRARHSAVGARVGDPPAGNGGRGIATAHGLAPEGDIPASVARVTTSVCTKNDIVCDWRSMSWELFHWNDASRRHESYSAALLVPLGKTMRGRLPRDATVATAVAPPCTVYVDVARCRGVGILL